MRVVDGLLHRVSWKFRALTSQWRGLPHFIIIGGMKCGTTALYNYLGQHPQVSTAFRKEIHFFDNQYTRGIEWYRRFSPLESETWRSVTGEASPYYMFHPSSARRIRKDVPGAKIIALLRDPVDRAFSHYQHTKRKGYETLSFQEAVKQEKERIEGEEYRVDNDDSYSSHAHQAYSYVSRGVYWKQLKRYYNHFEKSSILVVKSEDLLFHPQNTFNEVTDFLGLDSFTLNNTQPINKANYKRESTQAHDCLREFFKPHNTKLCEMVGRDFGWS